MFKKIISLLLVIATIFSFLVVPSHAEISFENTYFWRYFTLQFAFEDLPNFWKNVFSSDDPAAAYASDVSTLESAAGTTVIDSSGLWTIPVTWYASPMDSYVTVTSSSGGYPGFAATSTTSTMIPASLKSQYFTAPLTGTYRVNWGGLQSSTRLLKQSSGGTQVNVRDSTDSTVGYIESPWTAHEADFSFTAGSTYRFVFVPYFYDNYTSFDIAYFPVSVSILNFTVSPDIDVTPASRAGVLTGSYTDSAGTVYENITVVNEAEKTFYDPTTGTTFTYDHFAYDYATRTYTLYDADGNVIAVITYGDEQLTISQGGTDTPLNYAVPDDSGSGSGGLDSGESGSGTSLLDKIKDGIVGALSALIEGLFALIKTILTKLLSLAKDMLTFFEAWVVCVGKTYRSGSLG